MSLVKFLSLLEAESLYFCRADMLGDPFEGSIPRNMQVQVVNIGAEGAIRQPLRPLAHLPSDLAPIVGNAQREIRKWHFVNCWYASDTDSAAMWVIYASAHDGVAVRSTVGRLKMSLEDASEYVFIGRVRYIDFDQEPATWGNSVLAHLNKRDVFEHEHEVRAIVLKNMDPSPPGLLVRCRLHDLMESVVIAPQAADWFAGLVRSIVERYGVGCDVGYSPIGDVPYWGGAE